MKTDNTLLEEMLGDENIMKAYKQVKRNKGAPGIDGMTVNELKGYLDENIDAIREQIRIQHCRADCPVPLYCAVQIHVCHRM